MIFLLILLTKNNKQTKHKTLTEAKNAVVLNSIYYYILGFKCIHQHQHHTYF